MARLFTLLFAAVTYFDAHNHFTGILPYYAYANLPAYVAHFAQPRVAPSTADRRALYDYLFEQWYRKKGYDLGDRPFSPPDGQRFALGARAALVVFRNRSDDPRVVNGVLERVLSATPWSEFDSAYAFRGGPASDYLRTRFYGGDQTRLQADLCKATVLDLAATHIDVSEQSLPIIGGWHFENGRSEKLDAIECPRRLRHDASVLAALARMKRPMPVIRFVLMTLTNDLAMLPGGTTYAEWSKSGRCAPVPFGPTTTKPETIYHALMAQDDEGRAIVPDGARFAFFDDVAGIDTAGPETTCFTPEGMRYYVGLADAVYRAAKARRAAGWHGKLLVHTHVGEGSTIDYVPSAPARPWTFADTFARLPPVRSNPEQAGENVSALLAAIAEFERTHPDYASYVVFRMAHDTWASDRQAQAMHDEGVEADINLESNVATGAYPLSRMPLGLPLVLRFWIDPIAENAATNFQLNDLLASLVSSPGNVRQTGAILGDAALRFMLERGVRCLLGTDADGVEHSDIVKEYAYASSLIAYWNATDPQFRSLARGVDRDTLFDNVRWHEANMAGDAAAPY